MASSLRRCRAAARLGQQRGLVARSSRRSLDGGGEAQMIARRHLYAMFGVAMLVVAGFVSGGTQASAGGNGGNSTTGTLPPPLVEIVIYDGATLPATTLVACSELDCLGWSLPPNQWTWEVTETQNYVSWAVSNWANNK